MDAFLPQRKQARAHRQVCSEADVRPAVPIPLDRAVKSVPMPEVEPLAEAILFAREDDVPALNVLRRHFEREGRLSGPAAERLLLCARDVLEREPNVLRIKAPVVVFGDLHGQFYDMVAMLDKAGPPENHSFLFLGDYVDRGDFSCEVAMYALAMKLALPDRVFLLRGNHETRTISMSMTFFTECRRKYDEATFGLFMEAFDCLPVAAVVERGPGVGGVFCVHAGIGPDTAAVAALEAETRKREPVQTGPFWDLLWADPWDCEEEGAAAASHAWKTFAPNDYRRTSCKYGPRAVEKFLEANGLACIVRAHEVKLDGYWAHFVENPADLNAAKVVTLFSAPYYSEFSNAGAILSITDDKMQAISFAEAAPQPYCLRGGEDALSFTLPFICASVVSLLVYLIAAVKEEDPDDKELEADALLSTKVAGLLDHNAKVHKKQEEYRKVLRLDYHKNMRVFHDLLEKDRDVEALPEAFAQKPLPPGPGAIAKIAARCRGAGKSGVTL
eukprot:m51a1_g5119 hypothetical protein (501) ;mRNA; r:369347-371615